MELELNDVTQKAPELVPLIASSRLTLKKHKLEDHTARVVLVLDISESMRPLYANRQVHDLVAKTMALGFQFDDNGEIDVVAFGTKAHYIGEYGISNYKRCVDDILKSHTLEFGTHYEKPLEMLLEKYGDSDLPVYVQFVTDGDTQHREASEAMLRKMSSAPIFVQFMGLGQAIMPAGFDKADVAEPTPAAQPAAKRGLLSSLLGAVGIGKPDPVAPAKPVKKSRLPEGFEFLVNLDNMEGRKVDNANFFAIKDPAAFPDDKLYSLLMNEYPQWLVAAREARIL
ncbi:VWA domain-containing protein [Pseudomonas serbica]|uniref:VWA domain-containing protein n=1 Tax=Pseudomonas serbica TaxID=2965074 RepID=UPI00237B5EFE|nr:VWA domain-containing protein [Pseudomonas serbica]